MSLPGVDPHGYLAEVSRNLDTLTERTQIEDADRALQSHP